MTYKKPKKFYLFWQDNNTKTYCKEVSKKKTKIKLITVSRIQQELYQKLAAFHISIQNKRRGRPPGSKNK